MTPDLELVSHCYRYDRLLTYQLSSLVLWPPKKLVKFTVCYCEEDELTTAVVDYFESLPTMPGNVRISRHVMEHDLLMRRGVGRNECALKTDAKIIGMIDCDQPFGEGAIDALVDNFPADAVLCFPGTVWKCPHEVGDRLISEVPYPTVMPIDTSLFTVRSGTRVAIGGIQFLRGDIAREKGYAKDDEYHQRPKPTWQRTREDRVFRHAVQDGGTPIDVPNFFRIRHSKYGRTHTGIRN